jgi:hypothetical protein
MKFDRIPDWAVAPRRGESQSFPMASLLRHAVDTMANAVVSRELTVALNPQPMSVRQKVYFFPFWTPLVEICTKLSDHHGAPISSALWA